MKLIPLGGWLEEDAFIDRRWYFWHKRELRTLKRRFGKRVRRVAKEELRQAVQDYEQEEQDA